MRWCTRGRSAPLTGTRKTTPASWTGPRVIPRPSTTATPRRPTPHRGGTDDTIDQTLTNVTNILPRVYTDLADTIDLDPGKRVNWSSVLSEYHKHLNTT